MREKLIDQILIKQINTGDEKAFSILYEAYYVYLSTVAFYYLNEKEGAKEVVNDTFLKVWEKHQTLVYPIHSYLVKAIQNNCIDYIRKKQARERVYNAHKEEFVKSYQEKYIYSTPLPLKEIELQETEIAIQNAITQLSPRCQQIFKAYYENGQTPEEIATDLNITTSTVRVQIKNAYNQLKSLLKHLFSLFF